MKRAVLPETERRDLSLTPLAAARHHRQRRGTLPSLDLLLLL